MMVELLNVDASLTAKFDDLLFQDLLHPSEELSLYHEELLVRVFVLCHEFGGQDADAA